MPFRHFAPDHLHHPGGPAPFKPINPTLCSALRDATHLTHQRLHEAPLFKRLMHGALSMADYRILLGVYAAFYAAVGEPIRMARRVLTARDSLAAEILDEWAPLTLLRADLQACGQQPALPATEPLHLTATQSLGCLYVAEGSRLGARVLYRQLDKLFGAQQEGRSFLGASLQPVAWQALRNELDALPLQRAEMDQAIAGAVRTFALFEHLLQQVHDVKEPLAMGPLS